jgi:hypothetical protein
VIPDDLSFDENLWVKYAQSFKDRGEKELVLTRSEQEKLYSSCRRCMFHYQDDEIYFLEMLIVEEE